MSMDTSPLQLEQEVGISFNVISSKENVTNMPERTSEQRSLLTNQLRADLEARTAENMLLNAVISTVGSTLKLDEVLGHLVDIVVRAIPCHAAFFYLYDNAKERLTLAITNQQYKKLVGKIEMALGEGITGWVGMHLQPVILKEGALNDPRFRYFLELEEEKFQSTMKVLIIAKDRHLIGVIILHTVYLYDFLE